ncbi:MAG: hypothetical protein U0995_08860 [Erythrobacter sp.]|nr:hypothetical protein [Erythrobacter sp.]MDZ4272973.1 hypothetical protein [Erythrobacter sp.]MDZ4276135.1 hypothetical protein [Erythrobacter sp.]
MADKISLTEEEYLDEFGAAFRVGSKVLDASDRVAEMHKIVPGSQAIWHFTADDIRFKVTIEVAGSEDG